MRVAYQHNMLVLGGYIGIYKIYILRNPFSKEVFYVGQTKMNTNTRLSGHIAESETNKEKAAYIKELVDSGIKPTIETIEIIPTTCFIDTVMVNFREMYWISVYKEKGCPLLNKRGMVGDNTPIDYVIYRDLLEKGETKLSFYYCGYTSGGHNIYDEQKMILDGFSLKDFADEKDGAINKRLITPIIKTTEVVEYRTETIYNTVTNCRTCSAKSIKTEVFPEEPGWTKEFAASIPPPKHFMEDIEIDKSDYEFDSWDYEDDLIDNDTSNYEESEQRIVYLPTNQVDYGQNENN